jgi:Domain of unknown function (DUF4440)
MSINPSWKAASEEVSIAASDPRIAAVLEEVSRVDASIINDDPATFAASLADDLVVNNPLNRIAGRDAVAAFNASGHISYRSYERRIEYAGLRGELVLLMGEEIVTPKGTTNPWSGREVRRRFTDMWKQEGGRWVLTARQATVISS